MQKQPQTILNFYVVYLKEDLIAYYEPQKMLQTKLKGE